MKSKIGLAACVGLAGLLLAACSGNGETVVTQTVTATPTPTTASPAPSPTSTDSPAPTSADLDVIAAIDAAIAIVPGTPVEGDLTDEAGRAAWSIEIRDAAVTATEVYIDVATGELIRQKPGTLSELAAGTLPPVTAQEGIAAALAANSGSRATAFDLDREDGVIVWAVEVRGSGGNLAVYVDANSGQVLFSEPAD